MFPLGFITFPYLIVLLSKVVSRKSILNLFYSGFLFGLGFLIIYLFWIYNPFLVFDDTKPYAFLALLLPLFLSIFFGLGFLIYKLFNKTVMLILITPFIFIIIEFAISNFFYGFPWVSNSFIISNNFIGFYFIKYSGTIASGYLILAIFLLTTFFIYKYPKNISNKFALISYSPFLFLLIIIAFSIFNKNKNELKHINLDAFQILKPINEIDKQVINEKIINLINASKAEFIFFAENNFPYLIDKYDTTKLHHYIKNDKKIIIGGTTFEEDKYYNSILLIEKDEIQYFDKKVLVPFGEFLPLRNYLYFMKNISGDVDFQKGYRDRILTTKNKINLLPVICYEIIFDSIFDNINKKEIDIVVNITNDSWFGKKIGPYQHFYISRVKALIANKPFLRISNNGISAIIDNNGKILKFSKLNQISKLSYNLEINKSISFISFHNLFIYYLILIFVIILFKSKKFLNYEL